jgi:hypothetical protein
MEHKKLTFPVVTTRGSSYENRANLAPTFWAQLAQYEGTQLGRQEIHGEVLDPGEGAILKKSWFQLWGSGLEQIDPATGRYRTSPILPPLEYVVMSLDTAMTDATFDKKSLESDPTACTVWGVFQHKRGKDPVTGVQLGGYGTILLDVWTERLGFPDLIARVKKEMQIAYGGDEQDAVIRRPGSSRKPLDVGRKVDLILIEEKGSGISLAQMLERERIPTKRYNPGNAGKLERVHRISHLVHGGYVYLMQTSKRDGAGNILQEPASYYEDFLSEVCSYAGPKTTKHDDQVDSLSQYLRWFADYGEIQVTVKPEPEERDYDAEKRMKRNPYG